MGCHWFKINKISYGWFEIRIGEHLCTASDFLGYDMPGKFLDKVMRVITGGGSEWLYLMDEPGADMLHIYLKGDKVHFAEYDLPLESTELDSGDEKAERDKCEKRLFDLEVSIQDAVDGIVTEFSLYEDGNGRTLYEKHWDLFPEEAFEKLKAYAFHLQKKAGKYDGLLCTTFLKKGKGWGYFEYMDRRGGS